MIAAPPGTDVRDSVLVMVGQPNAGKTTLYNLLTGSRFKTVNYPGATVDYAVGTLRAGHGVQARVLDTPGIHSLVPQSEDERTALLALGRLDGLGEGFPQHPDLVLAVVDAMQLTRHLVLVRQIQRAGFRVVVALTMEDLARKDGILPDLDRLSARLGVPVVAVNGRTGKGVSQLMRACQVALESGRSDHPVVLPEAADEEQIRRDYEWAESIVARAGTAVPAESAVRTRSMKIDQIMLHPVLGLTIFVGIMSLLFWSVFSAAAPFMDGIDAGVSWLVGFLDATLTQAWWSDFLIDGLLAGAGAVLVFVPQIAILFFAVGILEDSGYLARGAVLIDRPLSLLGLNGRSFVPLLSGYACAVPAMMAARTIPGRRERFLTIFIIPLMSCSARLPVYGLLLAFLVPADKAWIGGLSLTAIYLGSLAVAAGAAVVAGRFIKLEHGNTGFQLELPLWRRPIWRNIFVSTWDKTLSYLKRAGPVIVLISLLFWAFSNYPSPDNSIAGFLGRLLEPVLAPMGVDWRVGMALIASFAAREVFVSALAVVFAVQGGGDSVDGLIDSMRGAVHTSTGEPLFTVATGVGLVLFFMVAMQCLTTIAVSRRETAGWKLPVAQMVAFLGLAYLLAVVAVQGLRALGIS